MSEYLNSPSARAWADDAAQRHSNGIFGKIVPAVIWSDARGEDGELLVPIDPTVLVDKINATPFPLLHNHDPGKPIGQVLESAYFNVEGGHEFVAAILGYYAGGNVLSFRELGLTPQETAHSPEKLPVLPDGTWIQLATDPREVDKAWVDEVTSDAPLWVDHTELSHNAADFTQELIRIGFPFIALVWNPYVTSIATEAGKDTYVAINKWVRKFLTHLADRRNPVLAMQAHQHGCNVLFLFRGKDVARHYVAHEQLPSAAVQAARLVAKLKERGLPGQQLVYEFDSEAQRWFPSYAILEDNRIITDNATLIAIEQLPTGLSLGISRGESLTPVLRSTPTKSDT